MTLLVGLLLLTAQLAADKPTLPGQQLEALKKEVKTARVEFSQAYKMAKTDQERQKLRDKKNKEFKACARRALELAQKHPKDPAAVDALSWIIAGGLGWGGDGAEIETAYDLLRKDYVTSDRLEHACSVALAYQSVSTKPERLLRDVIEKNPHHAMQAWARFSLARVLRQKASMSKMVRDQQQRLPRSADADDSKPNKGNDPDKLSKEAEDLLKSVVSKYGDVKSSPGTLGELAKAMLFEMRYLVVGKVAPEIEGEDIDGKRFKLSDYRGKVVVLDFWGHW
jgi:hypothetical protein